MKKKPIFPFAVLLFWSVLTFAQTPPIAVTDVDTADINTTLTVTAPGLLANDSDADGDALNITQFSVNGAVFNAGQTANFLEGSLTINTDGSYTFNPTAGYTGNVPLISYTISDGIDTSSAVLLLTVEFTTNLLNIEYISSCNQGYTIDGEYKIRYLIRISNTSTARDYHPSSLIKNVDLTDDLEAIFGVGCINLIDQVFISTTVPDDFVNNPYPQDWTNGSINTDFENVTSTSLFSANAIANNILYPRQTINVSFCMTVNPFCNGRPNPTPSGSGIDFDNIVNITSTIGNDTANVNITDFHTTETSVAANLFVPEVQPDVNPDGTFDFTNTVVITNEGNALATNVNFNMGLGNFIDNGFNFTTLNITQVSGPAVTTNNLYNGETNSELLAANQSLAAGETIILEIFYVIDSATSQDRNYFSSPTISMTQGASDGYDETVITRKRRLSYVTWTDNLGDHLDRYYIGPDATSPASSVNQCSCNYLYMNFLFSVSVDCQKTITNTNSAPNGIIEQEELTFQLTINNTSPIIQVENLQLQDNLNNICGGNLISISTPTIVNSTATVTPNLNAGFNGTTDLNIFDGVSGILEPNQNIIVAFSVIFNDDCIGVNTATFFGTDPLNATSIADGVVNVTVTNDNDNDGISNINDIDDDNDTIPDILEYNGLDPLNDTDNDSIPDYRDADFGVDSNNDGIVDLFDFDLDGIPNHFDLDSDNDGILDIVEVGNNALDTNNNGQTNNAVGLNGLDDTVEDVDTNLAVINYIIENTDGTGNANYLDIDADGDGIVDNIESQTTDNYIAPNDTYDANGIDTAYPNGITAIDTDNDTIFDYIDTNSDDDIRDDYIEGWDFDNDGTPETVAVNLDADNDGLDDAYDLDDSQINPSNGQTPTVFPNVDDPNTNERDWREILAIRVVISDVSVTEGGDLVFTISLTSNNDTSILIASPTPIDLDLATSDGSSTAGTYDVATAPFDYTAITTTPVTIPAFTTSIQFTVTTLEDNIYEIAEFLTLNGTVTSNNTGNTDPKGIGTIIDNELPPNISMNDSRENEGVDLVHTITLSHPSSKPIVIDVLTGDLTASSPYDYTQLFETLTIDGTIDPANSNLDVSFNITTIIDNLNEPDEEDLRVIGIVNNSVVGVQDLDRTGTIIDIDPDPLVIIDDATVIEGNTLVFTLSLVNPTTNDPMRNYQDINLNIASLNNTAFAPDDYDSLNTTTAIIALTESAQVEITTIDDVLNEETETMTLFATITFGTISNTTPILEAIGTILDNDIPNLFSPNDDGQSDYFKISGLEAYPNFKIKIYDRWGSEVYTYENNGSTNPDWWDGMYKESPAPEGVYYYNLDYNDGATKPKISFIQLIR